MGYKAYNGVPVVFLERVAPQQFIAAFRRLGWKDIESESPEVVMFVSGNSLATVSMLPGIADYAEMVYDCVKVLSDHLGIHELEAFLLYLLPADTKVYDLLSMWLSYNEEFVNETWPVMAVTSGEIGLLKQLGVEGMKAKGFSVTLKRLQDDGYV